jgi:hypothetical protein
MGGQLIGSSIDEVWIGFKPNKAILGDNLEEHPVCTLKKRRKKAKKPSEYKNRGKFANANVPFHHTNNDKRSKHDKELRSFKKCADKDHDSSKVRSYNNYNDSDENFNILDESSHNYSGYTRYPQVEDHDQNAHAHLVFANQEKLNDIMMNDEFNLNATKDQRVESAMYPQYASSQRYNSSNSNRNRNHKNGSDNDYNDNEEIYIDDMSDTASSISQFLANNNNEFDIDIGDNELVLKSSILDKYMNLLIFFVAGILLIIFFEQILQLGAKMDREMGGL